MSEARPALAVAEAGATFKALKPLFTQKQFLQAKDALDHFGRQAHNIGPQTVRVVSGLQRYTAGKIEEFSRCVRKPNCWRVRINRPKRWRNMRPPTP